MKSNGMRKVLWGIVIVVVIACGVSFYASREEAREAKISQEQSASVTLSVDGLYQQKKVAIVSDETVLGVLSVLNTSDPALALSTKEYPGMGVLVDGMNGKKNGTEKKYWQYKVNGVMPQVGADSYKLHDGDSIEWFFAGSQE